jgi:hypothetical protein
LSSRYEVSPFEGTYQFTTKNNIQYVCTFSDITENFDDFDTKSCRNLTNKSLGVLPSLDSRVGVTVTWILSEFFKGNDDVVIYVADTKDGRHEKRRQRFDRWLRDYPIAGVVIDDYTYENLIAGIIRKETGLHKSISEELRMKFDKMKEGYLGDS